MFRILSSLSFMFLLSCKAVNAGGISAGGVSDGGTTVPVEVECEFSHLSRIIVFAVLAAPYDQPYMSGSNSVVMGGIEKNGQQEIDFADRFPTVRRWILSDGKTLINYKEEIQNGTDVSVSTEAIKLSDDEKAKLKIIRKDLAYYSKGTLLYVKQNLQLNGFCIFGSQ